MMVLACGWLGDFKTLLQNIALSYFCIITRLLAKPKKIRKLFVVSLGNLTIFHYPQAGLGRTENPVS